MVVRFAAVHRQFMQSQPAILASAEARGAWVSVLVYASDIESDTIVGARAWNDRAWAAATGIDAANVACAVESGLLRWNGDDLIVMGFDYEGLASVKAHRKSGKRGGRPRTKQKPNGYPNGNQMGIQTETPLPTSPLLTFPSLSGPVPDSSEEAPPPREPAMVTFPCVGNGDSAYVVTQSMIDTWRDVWPAVDGLAEAKRAKAWVDANPTKRKTAKGMPRFLAAWMTRVQDAGGSKNVRPSVNGAARAPGRPQATQDRIDVIQGWVAGKLTTTGGKT